MGGPGALRRAGREGRSAGAAFEVSVVPRIRTVTRLNAVRAVRKRTRYQDDPTKTGVSTNEFKELRPYQPGDPFKWINWKATARAARADNLPLVNELEAETRRAAWIFLDVASYMDVGVPLSNPLESTVEASGTLAQYYLSRGSTLGAFAYNSSGGTGELLAPESGMRQFSRLMQMMAGLRPGPPEQDLLQSVERCKSFLYRTRPDVFVITRLDVQYARPERTRRLWSASRPRSAASPHCGPALCATAPCEWSTWGPKSRRRLPRGLGWAGGRRGSLPERCERRGPRSSSGSLRGKSSPPCSCGTSMPTGRSGRVVRA